MSKGYLVYKPKLRIEFSHKCAYCEIREPELGGAKSFHIDHYRPKKIFPDLINSYENLIYSCRNCNGYKSHYWQNYFDMLLGKIIVNPRKDKIENHIDSSNHNWNGITSQGKWTVKKLRLDSSTLSRIREDRIRIEQKISVLAGFVESEKTRLKNSSDLSLAEQQKIKKFIDDESKTIESFKRKISGPMD